MLADPVDVDADSTADWWAVQRGQGLVTRVRLVTIRARGGGLRRERQEAAELQLCLQFDEITGGIRRCDIHILTQLAMP